ncbi:MAG: substrate-binding domain-containing protein, partial [Planctomycetaceae bacterium]
MRRPLRSLLTTLAIPLLLLGLSAGCEVSTSDSSSGTAGTTVEGKPAVDGGLLKVSDKVVKAGDYIVLDTLTDQFDRAQAKANVEDTLSKHPDIAGMVGLFAYNPPAILEALKQAGRLGEDQNVQVIAFDEADETLQGIKDETVHGTVVQNPYLYGKKSIEVLAALEAGNTDVIPENKFIDIPARQIRRDTVDEFWTDLKKKVSGGAKNEPKTGKPRFAFVSNGVASFWTIASVGVGTAGRELGVNTEVLMPAEGIADQKRMIEDLVAREVQGIAVSPIDAEN